MTTHTKEIPKEVYDRAMEHGGHLTGADEAKTFSQAILCGYGLYGTQVYEEDGKYYVKYQCGDSCD